MNAPRTLQKSGRVSSLSVPEVPTWCHIRQFHPQHTAAITQLYCRTDCLDNSGKSVAKMKPRSVIVFLALLLTVNGTVSNSTTSAGFASNIISGLKRLVSNSADSNNVTANVTTTNGTRTNSSGLPPEVVCPPARPEEVLQRSDTAVTKRGVQLYFDT